MSKKKLIVVLLFITSFIFSSLALADIPPSWSEFEVKSANGKYIAEIRAKEIKEEYEPWNWVWKVTVFEIKEGAKKAIWSCDYDYDGYQGGLLSDDGSTFIYINRWYYENQPVVSIYQKGKKTGVLEGKDFNIKQSEIRKSVSHELWLEDSHGIQYKFVTNEIFPLGLEITTIDKKKHLIDLESAILLEALEKKDLTKEEAVKIAQKAMRDKGINIDKYYLKSIKQVKRDGRDILFITFDSKHKLQQLKHRRPMTAGGEIFVEVDKRNRKTVIRYGL